MYIGNFSRIGNIIAISYLKDYFLRTQSGKENLYRLSLSRRLPSQFSNQLSSNQLSISRITEFSR